MTTIHTFTVHGLPGVAISEREATLLAFMHNYTGPSGHFYAADQVAENLTDFIGLPCSATTARKILKRFDALGFLARHREEGAYRWHFLHDGGNCEMVEEFYNAYADARRPH